MKEMDASAAIVALTLQMTAFMTIVPQFSHLPPPRCQHGAFPGSALCSGFTSCSPSRVCMLISSGANSSRGRRGLGGGWHSVFPPLSYNFPISSQEGKMFLFPKRKYHTRYQGSRLLWSSYYLHRNCVGRVIYLCGEPRYPDGTIWEDERTGSPWLVDWLLGWLRQDLI